SPDRCRPARFDQFPSGGRDVQRSMFFCPCACSRQRTRKTPGKRIVVAVVQATYSGAVESFLADFKVDAGEMLSSKLLDRKTNGLSGDCKSSVAHGAALRLPTSERK